VLLSSAALPPGSCGACWACRNATMRAQCVRSLARAGHAGALLATLGRAAVGVAAEVRLRSEGAFVAASPLLRRAKL